MARRTQPPDFEAFGFDDDFDQILRGANPNPSREGCPTNDELVALSKRERPIGDPLWEHLLHCSPCYSEVREMQRARVTESKEAD